MALFAFPCDKKKLRLLAEFARFNHLKVSVGNQARFVLIDWLVVQKHALELNLWQRFSEAKNTKQRKNNGKSPEC
ncbi:MAG: hypothetical protein ACI9FR_001506 [Cryomorphaceae bacterium]|jgi:hypothetical protein